MLKEKSCMFSCGPRESLGQSTEESIGMGNKEESNTISFG